MHRCIRKAIAPLCLVVVGIVQAQDLTLLNLDDLVVEALQNNPQLRAARNETAAAGTKRDQATSWEAPQVGIEFFQTPIQSFPDPIKNGMETDYFIQQLIPFPGKLSSMGESADNIAGMAGQEYKALERRIIRDLKSAYYELFHVQRQIQVNAENQELVKKFTEIARKQYEVGMGKQADILRGQTELSSLVNEAVTLEKEKKSDESMINTILSRQANAPLGRIPDAEITQPRWTFDQLRPLALENRPELKGMNFNIGMNKAELTESQREYYPDIMARVTYKNLSNTKNDFWDAMIGVNIPLAFWSSGKYTAKVQENELHVRKAENDLASMQNMVSFEVQNALVKVQSNYDLVLLYKSTSIPQAEQTLQATLSEYETGKTEFLMVIDAYRMQLMTKLAYHMAVMNYMASEAELEQAVGLDIPHISENIQ